MNWRIIFAVIIILLFSTTSILAGVPQLMNYQGRLTNPDGTPVADDTYEVTFRIYDELSTQRWAETHNITTANGFFSVELGSNGAPIEPSHLDYDECWLGVQITGEPEISPRARLVTAPYAQRVSTVDGATGGDIFNASGVKLTSIEDFSFEGGQIQLFDETGWPTILLQPDADDEGGYITIPRSSGTYSGIWLDGNWAGSNDPAFYINGVTDDIYLIVGSSIADSKVQLPDSSISSPEIKDEPGIAQGILNTGSVYVTGETSMIDIITTTITIPAPGYVVLETAGQGAFSGTTSGNYIACQIDKTAGGSRDNNYYHYVGFSAPPNTSYIYLPISIRRTYYESSAGTYTYRLEALDQTLNCSKYIWNPVITATYFPTSYGTVSAIVTSTEAGDFDNAEQIIPASNGPDKSVGETGYRVDLRELELKAARARAAALEAEKELMEAQMEAQHQGTVMK